MPASVDLTAPVFPIQGGAAYGALPTRRMLSLGLKEGVMTPTDCKVSQRAAGAGGAVDISAGEALVQGDTVTRQALYHCVLEAALTGGTEITITAGHASLPRVDGIIIEVKDHLYDGSGFNKGTAKVLTGTATAGATAVNLSGAVAIPATAILLAYVEVPSLDTAIADAQIFDRRVIVRPSLEIPHTFAITAEIKAAVGDLDFIPPFFVPIKSGATATLKRVRHKINVGTNVTFKLTKNGSDFGYGTSGAPLTSTTTVAETVLDVLLTNNDVIALVVVSASGTPKNMSATLVIEYAN